MSKRPNLSRIEAKMKDGQPFTMTRGEYIASTGADLPQSRSYTEKGSAVSKLARKYGFKITVIPEKLVIEKEN